MPPSHAADCIYPENDLQYCVGGFVRTNLFRPRKDAKDAVRERVAALTVSYEALEAMRRANLEIEFGGRVDFDRCVECLRAEASTSRRENRQSSTATSPTRCESLGNLLAATIKADGPCLVCGSPVCDAHASPAFLDDGISVCGECSPLFSLEFVVDCVTVARDPDAHRRRHVDRLLGTYDRALLALRISALRIDDVADALERDARRGDGVGLGSGAVGMASGVAGVAAAAAACTPAGPPLLVASVALGGGAAAASAGSEAVGYCCGPRRTADRILALHAAVRSLSRLPGVLRDALLRDCIRIDHYLDEENRAALRSGGAPSRSGGGGGGGGGALEWVNDALESESFRVRLDAGVAGIGGAAAATKFASLLAKKGPLLWSRAARNAARSKASLAHLTFGVLSAATVAVEAKEMAAAIGRMRDGNPCEKAERIRGVKGEMEGLRETAVLARECNNYLAAMARRPVECY